MIIENLLIFLIDPCALTNTNWDFRAIIGSGLEMTHFPLILACC